MTMSRHGIFRENIGRSMGRNDLGRIKAIGLLLFLVTMFIGSIFGLVYSLEKMGVSTLEQILIIFTLLR